MTPTIKLLFDECLGKPLMEKLAVTLSASPQRPELKHVLDFQKQGVPDEEWIPKIKNEGYIVVTADRGKKQSKGGKLPRICAAYDVTHVAVSGTILGKGGFGQMQAIIEVWNEFTDVASSPPGSRYSLRMAGSAGHAKLVLMPPLRIASAKQLPPRQLDG